MSTYGERLEAYIRSRYDLGENWRIKSFDNLDNGVLFYGCIAPLITKGKNKGKPNWTKESGRLWKIFLTRSEVARAVYPRDPGPNLDYQHGHCAEYAIALHALLRAEGRDTSILVAHGSRFDESEDADKINVNIHCVVSLPDGTQIDSTGILKGNHLGNHVAVWMEIHHHDDPEYHIASYALGEELATDFEALGLPLDVDAIALAARDILNSNYYQNLCSTN